MWRYGDVLPLASSDERVTIGEGWTPLIEAPRTAATLGCSRLLVKDEGQNPTGTFKDRSASYAISRLKARGANGVILNSTGNASASFSIYAARAGISCIAIVPEDVLDGNVLQMRASGARIERLADWTQAASRTRELAMQAGYIDVSADRCPDRGQAKRTIAYEIAEQLGWRAPDAIFFPTGGGLAVLAVHAAFSEMLRMGQIEGAMPRIFVSQYAGCAPIVAAYDRSAPAVEPWSAINTPRGGMRTASPRLGTEVLSVLSANGGAFAIEPGVAHEATISIAGRDGILLGLEAGTALAAVAKAIEHQPKLGDATVVVINTASCLKSDPQITKQAS